MNLPVNPDDWTEGDWDLIELQDQDEPPCSQCGKFDSFITVEPGKYGSDYKCMECGFILKGK
jgi:predicted RNA-binding Zn-ribbon protein involved in translation (DUF1610 family)